VRYPLILALRPSGRARLLIAAIHLVAAFAFLGASLSPALVLPILLLLALSGWQALSAEQDKAGRVLVLDESGLVGFGAPGGRALGNPLPGCADFGWAVWLQWRADADGRRTALMLLPDNVPPETWRGVRAWLRHKAAAGRAEEAA